MAGRQPLWPSGGSTRQRLRHINMARTPDTVFIKALRQATAVSTTPTGHLFDMYRSIVQIQARPVTKELRVSCQTNRVSVARTLVDRTHNDQCETRPTLF